MKSTREEKIAEEHINFIAQNIFPKALTLDEIKTATKTDSVLQRVIELIKSNKWKLVKNNKTCNSNEQATKKQLQSFAAIQQELSVTSDEGIVLRGTRIVIPAILQRKTCQLTHQGQQGIVKTKKLLRQKIWFYGIDSMVESIIKSCLPCQTATPENTLLKTPWDEVCADFIGLLPSADYLLIVYDEYSRYPEVERVTSTSSNATIPVFDKIFATHGIPSILKTDNGPPFNNDQFELFAQHLGFHHRKVTPYWSRANGDAERFIKTLEKALQTAEAKEYHGNKNCINS
ncbi:uncharacterized protein K02A2.6-like [Gigantopelta aegis]|uniref:uncharacterized protein K02A2.6-like n=1 Tax=Gigantopelta aegis TaxID=1735272 RepID=UPI001B889E87|nr:uncharacterized protein K02A2.6-like [Gigantopelta aegis]